MTIMTEQLRGLLGALEGALLDEAGASAGPTPAAADASIAAGEAPPW
jgi:hypothetical protein